MRVCLVTMPWQALDIPSLQLGLLSEAVRSARPDDQVELVYGNVRWAEHVLQQTSGEITPDDYTEIVEDGLFHGLGDWVFTSALYPNAVWPVERYDQNPRSAQVRDGPARRMRELAPSFVAQMVEDVLDRDPDIVGVTSTFMQNVPSLALLAELKRRRPELSTVMGGGNCDGPMGAALHRNFSSVDYVVRGEGEIAVVALLDALETGASHESLSRIGGLCWRDGTNNVVNPPSPDVLTMEMVPTARFDEFFDAVDAGAVREYIEPKIVHEAARGCWWGMIKHCTFCGLNGSTMSFRSKSPERVFAEIGDDVRRHGVLDVVMVDNIMDTSYMGTLLPKLAETGWDLRMHYEVKSNLRHDDIQALAEAGVVNIQPGIESLSARVLKIMEKGVDGVTNVRVLRDCEDLRVTAPWNLLYGFPGEQDADYRPILAQLPNLHHLQPPRVASRIALERFSPYHQRPDLGFAVRRPAAFYDHVYDLPTSELMDLVYVFDCDDAGITGDVEDDLLDAVRTWQDSYVASTLTVDADGGELLIADRRSGREVRDHLITEAWQVAGYALLADGHGQSSLMTRLARLDLALPTGAQIGAWFAWLAAEGLVFHDAGRFVALATNDVPARVPVTHWQ